MHVVILRSLGQFPSLNELDALVVLALTAACVRGACFAVGSMRRRIWGELSSRAAAAPTYLSRGTASRLARASSRSRRAAQSSASRCARSALTSADDRAAPLPSQPGLADAAGATAAARRTHKSRAAFKAALLLARSCASSSRTVANRKRSAASRAAPAASASDDLDWRVAPRDCASDDDSDKGLKLLSQLSQLLSELDIYFLDRSF